MRVLVAYASKHGSTKGIAERIGADLRQDGHEVDVLQAKQAGRADDYDAVVVGSAAYATHWMREASSFVKKNRGTLEHKPLWFFSSGPLGTEKVDKEGHDVAEAALPKEAQELASLHPRDHHVFWGALDMDELGLGGRMLMRLPAAREGIPQGDFRDWDDIDQWAHGIARDLATA